MQILGLFHKNNIYFKDTSSARETSRFLILYALNFVNTFVYCILLLLLVMGELLWANILNSIESVVVLTVVVAVVVVKIVATSAVVM
jgi:hypothetical protein